MWSYRVCTNHNSDYSLLQSEYLPTVGGISPENYSITRYTVKTSKVNLSQIIIIEYKINLSNQGLYAGSSNIHVSMAPILLMFVTKMCNECLVLAMYSYSKHTLLNYLHSEQASISNTTE